MDIATIAIFSALWAVLNLTVGPLGFTIFRLPIFCDLSVYLTLLLATWASGRRCVPSMVGLVGALIVLALRPASTHMFGFLASAVLFDAFIVWGMWHLVGELIGLAVALLVIGFLEKAGVKGPRSV